MKNQRKRRFILSLFLCILSGFLLTIRLLNPGEKKLLIMQCKKCDGKLEVLRMCRRVRLVCTKCRREYQIHEVADRLDAETEAKLELYTSIIYD